MGNATCCEKAPSLEVQTLPQTPLAAAGKPVGLSSSSSASPPGKARQVNNTKAQTTGGAWHDLNSREASEDAPLSPPLEDSARKYVPPAPAVAAPAPDVDDVFAPRQKNTAPAAVDFSYLEGSWLDLVDKEYKPICVIQDSIIHWDEELTSQIAPKGTNEFSIVLDEEEITARFQAGVPASLLWNDGAVWIREELQGTWYSQNDGQRIAEIKGEEVHWDIRFGQAPSVIAPTAGILPHGAVKMRIADQEDWGIFDPGPPARISWNDGELWFRNAMEPS